MRDAELYIELITPAGKSIVTKERIDGKIFHDYLGAIHINKNPFVPDNIAQNKNIATKRDGFVDFIKDKIEYHFQEYFNSIDTVDGYSKKEYGS